MSGFKEYDRHDGLGLAELVRNRDVTEREILEAAIERAETDGKALNAICHEAYDVARLACSEDPGQGLLQGVPFLLKDLAAPMPGIPESEGCVFFANSNAPVESESLGRLRRSGVNIFGRTTSAEMGLSFTTDSPIYGGPTRNPWNTDLTPGGSSGGASAVVGAGVVPIAHGNDGAGSIRVPAACCGVFGLKPTRARLPSGPYVGEGWAGIAFQGVISRTVRDTAAALEIMEGRDLGAPYPEPERQPFLQQIKKPPAPLRIAFMTRTYTGESIHPDCVAAVVATAKLCEELGHHVEEAELQYDFHGALKASIDIVSAGVAQSIREGVAIHGRQPTEEEITPTCRGAAEYGARLSAVDYMNAVDLTHATGRHIARFFVDYDILLTPTTASPPVAADRYPLTAPDLASYWEGENGIFKFAPFTHIANVSGQPAASIPLHWNAEGLPIGTQIIARFGDETTLLRLSAQLEAAKPWFDRRPPRLAR